MVQVADTDLMLIVVLLEVRVVGLWQLQAVDAIVGGGGADVGVAQVLEGEVEGACQGVGQHGLKKHAAGEVLVVLDEATQCLASKNTRIVCNLKLNLWFHCSVQACTKWPLRHKDTEKSNSWALSCSRRVPSGQLSNSHMPL